MIKEHQPTIFKDQLSVVFSSASDGSMRALDKDPNAAEVMARWLPEYDFNPGSVVGIAIEYGPEKTYDVVTAIEGTVSKEGAMSKSGWIPTDAMITGSSEVAVLLPVADCVATVVYDPVVRMLGVLHLGRHSSISHLIESFQKEASDLYGSQPVNWKVWMSPSLQKQSNLLDYFTPESPDEWSGFVEKREDGKLMVDIPAHNIRRFELLGVMTENIEVSGIDTYTDVRYYSHRAATDQNDSSRQGRMVVVAQIKPGTGPTA